MPWQEITFTLGVDQTEAYEDALISMGALSITMRDAEDQPILEPEPDTTPLWDQLFLTAMFEIDASVEDILASLQTCLQTDRLAAHRVAILEDQEWRLTWKDHFRPMQFGQRLWICPSGYEKPQQTDAIIIDLDPGLAFGTGSHPTTALCLQWLDGHSIRDKIVIDYGCGSGILAIAAAKMGARQVIAIDNDPQALLATHDNAAANSVDHLVEVMAPDSATRIKADILIANILLEPLTGLTDVFRELLGPAGELVMSGVLETQTAELRRVYEPYFNFLTCGQQEEWVRLHAMVKSS